MQYEIRTYTLSDPETAKLYFTNYWPKHIISLAIYNIGVKDVFINIEKAQVIAICTFDDTMDIQKSDIAYMKSPEFKADMFDFPMKKLLKLKL